MCTYTHKDTHTNTKLKIKQITKARIISWIRPDSFYIFFTFFLKFFLRGAMTTEPVILDVFVILSLCQISETGNSKQKRFTVDPSSQGFSPWLAGSIALLWAWGRTCGIRTWQRQAVYLHLTSAREKRKRGSKWTRSGWWTLARTCASGLLSAFLPCKPSWQDGTAHLQGQSTRFQLGPTCRYLWESPQRHAPKCASQISESLKPIKLIIQMKHALHPLCSWITHWTVTSRPLLPPGCCGRIKCHKTKLCTVFINWLEANSLSERLSWGQWTFKCHPRFPGTIKAARLKKTVWDKGKRAQRKVETGNPSPLKFPRSENFVTRTRGLKIQYATSVWRLLQ